MPPRSHGPPILGGDEAESNRGDISHAPRQENAEWAPAVALAALREREVRQCYVAGHPLAVVLVDGAVYAVDGRCPHWGATFVDGPLRGDSIRCPLHGFRYDMRSGAATWPEGWPAVTTYATRVDDGVVYVHTAWRR